MYLLLLIVVLIVVGLIALRTPYVKNKIALEGLGLVNQDFGTDISADHVEINWKNNLILNDVVAKDDHDYPFIKIKRVEGDINIIELVKYLYSQDWSFKNLKFKKLILDDPVLDIYTYKGEDKDNLSQFIAKFDNGKPPSDDPFVFQSDVDFNNGLVKVTNLNKADTPSFRADSLNFKIANFKTKGSVITADLEEMNANMERFGKQMRLDDFQSNIYYSQTQARLDSMTFVTPGTKLKTEVQLNYQSTDDFKNFDNLVNLNVELKNGSYMDGNFLDFLTGNWDNNSTYNVHALATGTINDLLLSQLGAYSKEVQIVAKSVKLNQITSKIDYSIDLTGFHAIASEKDLKAILPSDIANKLDNTIQRFGTLDYQGNLFLNSEKVKGDGQLLSSLGNIILNAELNDYSSKDPRYQGTIDAKNVTLYPILENQSVRQLTGKFDFKGEGFNPKTAKIALDGHLAHITFEKYDLQNIDLNVNYHQQIVDGKINSLDPQATLDAEGEVNFQQAKIIANLKGNIKNLNLETFEPKQKGVSIQALFDVEAQASNMNDLVGKLNFQNVIYNSPEKVMAFNEIDINTYLEDKDRILNINAPNSIHGVLKGRFNLDDIPIMFQNGISKMVVGLKPAKKLDHKYLFMDLDIEDNVIDLIVPNLDMQSGSNIIGTYDSETNDLILNLSAPQLTYDKLIADSINLKINTDNPSQQFLLQVNSLYYDKYIFKRVNSSGYLSNDTLRVENTFNLNNINNQLVHLNLFQTENSDELIVGVEHSNFEVNGVEWLINPQSDVNSNLITYNKNDKTVYLNRFSLKSNLAEINAKGYYKNAEDFNFDAVAENVLLENIIPKNSLGEFKLKGLINGNVEITQSGHILSPLADIKVKNLEFNSYEMGDLNAHLVLDPTSLNQFDVDVNLNKNDQDYFLFVGKINNSSNEPATINGKATLNDFEMDILNELLSGVFKNIRGTCYGDINISGQVKNPDYVGTLFTKDLGLTITYLNTDYLFKNDSEIDLGGNYSQGTMFFNNIGFIDTKELTEGNLVGPIMNHEFKVWNLNLDFESTDDNGLLILNTDDEDNDLFYGKVYGKGTFSLYGSTDDKLSVYSNAEILKDSKFTFNNATTYNIDNNSIIHFTSSGNDTSNKEPQAKVDNSSGLALNFLLDIEEGAQINILLDELTSSTIQVEGEAKDFSFVMSETGEMSMNGTYLVEDGYYNFKIGPITKKFRISNDSYIYFTGNPYDAQLNIHAYNELVVSNIGDYLNIQTSPTTIVDLGVDLKGTLNEMTIDFTITAPDADSDIQSMLKSKFYNNQDEERLQFMSLLSSRRFNTEESAIFSTSTLKSNAYDLVINQVTGFFNTINPNWQLSATYVPSDVFTNSPDMLQATMDVRLNNRWQITTTQGIPISTTSTTNSNIWTSPEVEVEYDVSQKNDGSFILEGFTRPTTFGLQNNALNSNTYQTYGGGIILRWEFDRFKDFIQSKKLERKKNQEKEKQDSIAQLTDSAAIIEKQINDLLRSNGIIQ